MNSILKAVPLFSRLSDVYLDALSGQTRQLKYARNTIIITEGEESDSLYIVNTGKVKIYISDTDGKEMQLKILGPGDYFGELALMDQKPRSASAMTLCDSELFIITSKGFLTCLSENHEMALIMLRVLTKRLRDATELQRQLALLDVYGRLKVNLLASAKDIGGVLVLDPKPTQQDFANKIGSSREMVSRILTDLKALGYIDILKTSIIIKKSLPDKL